MKNKKFENLYINALQNSKLEGVIDILNKQKELNLSTLKARFL